MREHEAAGRYIDVGGVRTFVREQGTGAPVLLFHGVPVSSYLWRRMLPELAARGLQGIAPDYPGLGLSARPASFDYSWTGLGRHLTAVVDHLGLDRFHMVMHDIGGPVGFEVAAAMPNRVASLTVLNTIVDAANFTKPWPMRPFEKSGLDRIWLAAGRGVVFRQLMRYLGYLPNSTVSNDEIGLHRWLLSRDDGGRAFLKIMHSFETTREKTLLYTSVLRNTGYPVQVVWGKDDPALTLRKHGRIAADAAGLSAPEEIPGKHFTPEDSPDIIAQRVARIAADSN